MEENRQYIEQTPMLEVRGISKRYKGFFIRQGFFYVAERLHYGLRGGRTVREKVRRWD